MKRSGHQPRLLTAVMEAIANLKDGKGSTQKRIIDQVQCLLNSKNVSLRNVTVHIRKALKHGVESGLIKQKGGKFKLGLDTKDYAIFKSFQKMDKNGDLPLTEHRRRGGRRRRRKRRRSRRKRRRRSMEQSSPDEYVSESGSGSEVPNTSQDTGEPTDKSRRRRRKKRRRRGRRGRRHTEERDSSSSARSDDTKEVSPKASDEHQKSQKKGEQDDGQNRSDEDEENNDADDPDCGNPQCLCNIKQEMSDMPYRSSAHEAYRDPYTKQ